MSADQALREYVLGIDLGTNSVGWAIIALVDDEPHHLIRAGVRVFEAGMEGDLASGREESRNLKRRQMRLQRRQTWRRARRAKRIFNLLQRYGLLPQGTVTSSEERQDFINRLDGQILESPWFAGKSNSGIYPESHQVMPYILRAAALDEQLQPYSLGRALYHLAQRRGFLSNRKQVTKKKDDDEGAVKEGIAEIRKAMQEKSARTLAEYFAHLSPSEERIRCRWTARDMFEKEFDAIWSAQSAYQPGLLTETRKKELHRAIFFQRPLWFDRNTVGRCELEPGDRRAPIHLLIAQRFRLFDRLNNLKINGAELRPDDRRKLAQELELHGDLTFAKLRKLLGLTKDDEINLARGGEEKLIGNRTFSKFHKALGQRWLDMTPDERDRMVEYVFAFEKADKLETAARRKWNLDEKSAQELARIALEPDYLNLSVAAIRKLLPLIELGMPFASARKQVYPDSFRANAVIEVLPPVDRSLTEIRNPAVMRSLTELRKVVNAVVRQYGKPTYIRVELARDLKKSRKQRAAISENSRRNEKSRTKAAEAIIKSEVGIRQPRPDDIRKFLLAEECRWQCPYTGETITPRTLFGPEPQFDIEHIIPFSRSMDGSFANLTLCYAPANRNVKGNRTPYQAYGGDPDNYQTVLARVKQFIGERSMSAAKLRRFMMNDEDLESFLADFRDRQLNDTAYATSLAARYLGLLYGGTNDSDGTRRIQATSGQSTHYFRSLWKLNSILNDGPTANGGYVQKSRADHRHHAIDAVVIGLTDAAMIKRLSDAAQRAPAEKHRRFASLEAPWHNFVDSIRAEVAKIVVSHRVSKKVSGPLHEETIYSAPTPDGTVSIRKPLSALTRNEIEEIADSGVKALVAAKLNGGDPKKSFSIAGNLPFFRTSDGREILIKRVRLKKSLSTFTLRHGRSARHVANESNHHVEIYTAIDQYGREGGWDGDVVSGYEACQRLKSGEPIVRTDHGPLAKFKFSLAPGEIVECNGEKGGRNLWVVRGATSQGGSPRLFLVPVNEAREKTEIAKAGLYWRPFLNPLRKLNARKVIVNSLGEVSEAHD
jgi:CRISPR-associated endonuclease Csn1